MAATLDPLRRRVEVLEGRCESLNNSPAPMQVALPVIGLNLADPRSSAPAVACLDVSTLTAVISGTGTCPICKVVGGLWHTAYNPSGLDGSWTLNRYAGLAFEWRITPVVGAYNGRVYSDSGCTSYLHDTTGGIFLHVWCIGGLYEVQGFTSVETGAGLGVCDIFRASNVAIGVAASNDYACGGTVTLSA